MVVLFVLRRCVLVRTFNINPLDNQPEATAPSQQPCWHMIDRWPRSRACAITSLCCWKCVQIVLLSRTQGVGRRRTRPPWASKQNHLCTKKSCLQRVRRTAMCFSVEWFWILWSGAPCRLHKTTWQWASLGGFVWTRLLLPEGMELPRLWWQKPRWCHQHPTSSKPWQV